MAKVSKKSGPRKVGKGKGDGHSPTLTAPASNPGVHPHRPKRGGCGVGSGIPPCGKDHADCPRPGRNSYCGEPLNHTGFHKCKSCGELF